MITQDKFFRFLRFCTVGTTVAVIDFSLVWLLSSRMPPLVAVSLAYFCAVCCHFLLNKTWVFQCRRSDYLRQLAEYFTVVITSWSITIAVVHFCLSTFTQNVLIAKLCALPPATLVAFLLMQLFVFRRPRKNAPETIPTAV
jgi:putative flippase GtrA